jgi:hypothetical protein
VEQFAERAAKPLVTTASVASLGAAGAGQMRAGVIGRVPIQPAFQEASGQGQNPLPNRHFQRFQAEILDGLADQQACRFMNDVSGQRIGEGIFLASSGASSFAGRNGGSQSCSLTATSSRTKARNR